MNLTYSPERFDHVQLAAEVLQANPVLYTKVSAACDIEESEVPRSLYAEGGVAEAFDRVFTRQQAAAWTDLNYHDAAERYFRAARGDP